ncbi:LytS family sensor histidine kinase [Sphingobacterium griseoflavum]|uniref:Signal transduction histidine kinase internal region domain-containing protein n=1 Tax=Sphingobacterium griseoflavum TaxID=1474952 RepID=A0ABQ3HXM5_9SPHI|nr:hypothetical protein [Sphingobacterium griseoflavum]GHE44881.1 hypothetical protein GCM10017764_30140 [Sphingobacterium griseoflavum]
MGSFLDSIFGSKIELDLVKIDLEAKLCFHESRADSHLANLVFTMLNKQRQQEFLQYMGQLSQLSEEEKIPVSREIELLRQYIGFYQDALDDQLYLQFDYQVELERDVPAFILFPLVRNAITNGYNSMQKFPVKIKIRVYEKAMLMEVSNHVNHHIASQENNPYVDHYKSRLISCYADKYDLLFNSNSHTFKSNLHICI